MIQTIKVSSPVPKVLVVGAGNIGSRHVQGLARARTPMELSIVDPVTASRELTQQRFLEVAGEQRRLPALLEHIDEAPEAVDLAVVATQAAIRRRAIEALLGHSAVRHLVLEKVLFQ